MRRPSHFLILVVVLFWMAGCSTLIGNVRPVDGKSDAYRVEDLTRTTREWQLLSAASINPDSAGEPETVEQTKTSDLTFQSKRTASIISLNSACRPDHAQRGTLKDFSRLLFLGISDVQGQTEREFQIQGINALETTLEGMLSGERVKLRTVVLRKEQCVYDLMFVSRPEFFATNESDFSRFVSSFKLN